MTEGAGSVVDRFSTLSLGPAADPIQLGASTSLNAASGGSGAVYSGSFLQATYRDIRDGGATYRFLDKPVCCVCGEPGHLASLCSTPLCSICEKYGHASGCCSDACSTCGRHHVLAKGKRCKAAACRHCSRFGHAAEHCPHAECMRCGYPGHMMSKCPLPAPAVVSYSSAYGSSAAARAAKRAGTGLNDGGQSLNDSLLASNDSDSSKAVRKVPRQSSVGDASTGDNRLQLAAKLLAIPVVQPPTFELLPPAATAAEEKDRCSRLVYALFAQHSDYAAVLMQDQDKLACLARIAPSDLDSIIANPSIEQILDAIYQQYLQRQQEEEYQQQLELDQQRQREQYELKQRTLEHQRRREQQDRRQYYQRQRAQFQAQQQHRGQYEQQPRQHQHGPHQQQQQQHISSRGLPSQQQPHRPQHTRGQQQRQVPVRPRGPALNVLDSVLPKGGKVGDVLVCLLCGGKGHQVDKCRTPYCSECCKYGHPAGACKSACLR